MQYTAKSWYTAKKTPQKTENWTRRKLLHTSEHVFLHFTWQDLEIGWFQSRNRFNNLAGFGVEFDSKYFLRCQYLQCKSDYGPPSKAEVSDCVSGGVRISIYGVATKWKIPAADSVFMNNNYKSKWNVFRRDKWWNKNSSSGARCISSSMWSSS